MSQNKVSNSFLYKKLTYDDDKDKNNEKETKKEDEEKDGKKKQKKYDAAAIKEKTSQGMGILLSIFQTLTNPIWNLLYLLSYIVNINNIYYTTNFIIIIIIVVFGRYHPLPHDL